MNDVGYLGHMVSSAGEVFRFFAARSFIHAFHIESYEQLIDVVKSSRRSIWIDFMFGDDGAEGVAEVIEWDDFEKGNIIEKFFEDNLLEPGLYGLIYEGDKLRGVMSPGAFRVNLEKLQKDVQNILRHFRKK